MRHVLIFSHHLATHAIKDFLTWNYSMDKLLIAGIAVIILVLIIAWWFWPRQQDIAGFWSADSEFCAISDIDDMLIYFGEKNDGARECFMIITPDVAQQQFTIRGDDVEYAEDSEIWPDKLHFDRVKDTLYISDESGQKLFAKLHSRPDLNSAAEDNDDE